MIPVLLILIPLIAGLASFFLKNDKAVRSWVLLSSFITLAVSVLGLTVLKDAKYLQHHCEWMQALGSSFSVKLDGMGQLLCLLNAIAYPLVILSTWNSSYKKSNNFFALMLLAQAGMMGVFLANGCIVVLFLLGTGIDTYVFSLFAMGWRKKNCCYFQILYLHFRWFTVNAYRDFVCVFSYS